MQVKPMKRSGTTRGNPFIAQFNVLLTEEEGKYNKMDTTQLKAILAELDSNLEKELKALFDTYKEDKRSVGQVLTSRPK